MHAPITVGVLGILVFFIDNHFFFKAFPFILISLFISKAFALTCYRRLAKPKFIKRSAEIPFTLVANFLKHAKKHIKNKQRPFLKKVFLFIIVPLVIYFYLYTPDINRPIDLYHEGESLASCQEIIEGKMPYKDFYVLQGVLHNVWLPYAGIKLFGETVEGYRRFYSPGRNGLVAPLGYVSLYLLCIFLFRKKFTAFLTVFFLLCSIGYDVISGRQTFAILALAFMISFIDIKKLPKLFCSGICTAIAIMYSTEFGAITFVSIISLLILYRIILSHQEDYYCVRYLSSYISGFIIGVSPFVLYLIKNKALTTYLNITFYDSLKLRPYIWGLPFRMDHEVKYFPILVFIIGTLWLMRNVLYRDFGKTTLKSIALLTCGILYFYPALIRPDSTHIRYASFLAYIIIFIPLESFFIYLRTIFVFGKKKLWQHLFLYNAVSTLCIIVISVWALDKFSPKKMVLQFIKKTYDSYTVPADSVRLDMKRMGGIYVREKQAQELQNVVNFIQNNTKKSDYIYDFSNRGLYYFLADRKNPTRYPFAIYASPPYQQHEVVRDLIKHKPKYIISGDNEMDGVENVVRFPIIQSYIDKHYRRVFEYNTVDILEYKE